MAVELNPTLQTVCHTDGEKGQTMGVLKDRASKEGAYTTEVNKGDLNMSTLTNKLNNYAKEGWRLHSIFPQGGNTVMVFERTED